LNKLCIDLSSRMADTPTEEKYEPKSVQEAWDNHFKAFGGQDVKMILKDYCPKSIITVHDHTNGKTSKFEGKKGARECFKGLFGQLNDLGTLKAPVVTVCEDSKTVFLIWSCHGCGIKSCTDTFVFDDRFKIIRQNVVLTSEEYLVHYHSACKGFWGRAAAIVLTLDTAGVPFRVEGAETKPEGIFAVPAITLPSGASMGQTPSILMLLGQKFNLMGSTDAQKVKCAQALLDMNDIFGEAVKGPEGPWAKTERKDKWFNLMETQLGKTKFLACNSPTIADFQGVFAFSWAFAKFEKEETIFEKFPNCKRWWAELKETAAVKKMLSSGIPMCPPSK